MKKRIILLTLLCIGFLKNNYGQNRTFENISKMKLKSSGTIIENEEIRGYYFFYKVGKSSKGKNTYILRIIDENLEDIKTTTMEEGKQVFLAEGSYNGKAILLKFIDLKERKMMFMTFGKNAELLNKSDRALDRNELMLYRTIANSNVNTGALFDINGKGFVDYTIKDRGRNYSMNFISSNENTENWKKTTTNKKGITDASYLCNSESHIYSLVAKKPSISSNKITFAINAYSISSGTKSFETAFSPTDKYSAQPLSAYYDESKKLINVVGIYYEPNTKALKDNGLGLFNYQLDIKGEIVSKKYLSWMKDFRKFVTVDDKGKVSNDGKNGFIYFHDIIQHPDGSVIAVGEQYKKAADAAGIAAKMLVGNGAASSTKVVIRDIVIFHFTPEFDLKSVEFVEKSKSDFTLPSGYGFVNIHLLSQMVKYYNGFDYSFTNMNSKEGVVSIGYVDWQRNKGKKNELIFGAITYNNGQFSKDKIPLQKRKGKSWTRVMRAKPGYVMLLDYDSKEKSLTSHLEKINY